MFRDLVIFRFEFTEWGQVLKHKLVKETARYLQERCPAICQRRREDQKLEQKEGNAKVVSKELRTGLTNPERTPTGRRRTREYQEKTSAL